MLTRYANKFEVGFFMFSFLFFSMTTPTYRSEVNLGQENLGTSILESCKH